MFEGQFTGLNYSVYESLVRIILQKMRTSGVSYIVTN